MWMPLKIHGVWLMEPSSYNSYAKKVINRGDNRKKKYTNIIQLLNNLTWEDAFTESIKAIKTHFEKRLEVHMCTI